MRFGDTQPAGHQQRTAHRHAAIAHVRMHKDALHTGKVEDLLVQAHVGERAAGKNNVRDAVLSERIARRLHQRFFDTKPSQSI
jgi:hypothetical protein